MTWKGCPDCGAHDVRACECEQIASMEQAVRTAKKEHDAEIRADERKRMADEVWMWLCSFRATPDLNSVVGEFRRKYQPPSAADLIAADAESEEG